MQQNTTNSFVTLNCGRNDFFTILVYEIVKEVSMLRQTNAQTNKTYIMLQSLNVKPHANFGPHVPYLPTKENGGEKNKERSAS